MSKAVYKQGALVKCSELEDVLTVRAILMAEREVTGSNGDFGVAAANLLKGWTAFLQDDSQTWQCIVGKNFGSWIKYDDQGMIHFVLQNGHGASVLLFSKQSSKSEPALYGRDFYQLDVLVKACKLDGEPAARAIQLAKNEVQSSNGENGAAARAIVTKWEGKDYTNDKSKSWNCIVGRTFGWSLSYDRKGLLHVVLEDGHGSTVLLFKKQSDDSK